MSVPKPGDLGIILAKAGAVGAAYVDISGNTQAYTLIHGLYAAQGAALVAGRDYSRPAIGKSQKLSLFVTVTLAGATDIKLKLQSRYQEGDAWADMQTQRCDTGSTTLEQTFSADGRCLCRPSTNCRRDRSNSWCLPREQLPPVPSSSSRQGVRYEFATSLERIFYGNFASSNSSRATARGLRHTER